MTRSAPLNLYRCQCGRREQPYPAPCETCELCGSTFVRAADGSYQPPTPHRIVARLVAAQIVCRCVQCWKAVGTVRDAENLDEIRAQVAALVAACDPAPVS